MIKYFCFLMPVLVLYGSVSAQTLDTVKTLQPIEVRAVRSSENAPFASEQLNKKTIAEKNLGQDIPYLLQYGTSTVVNSDAGTGIGYTGIRIRGTDGSRINVTLNGIPVNDAESQGTFFVNFSDLASSLNSIQITRGVGSSTNGSGAFGATMSMSNLDNRDNAGGEIRLGLGSFQTMRSTLSFGTGWQKNKLALDGRFSLIKSNGFVDRSHSDLSAMQFNATWKITNKTQLKALVMTGREKTGQAWNGVPEEKLKEDATALQEHYNNNIGILYFSPQDSINLFQSNPQQYNYFTYKNQTDNYQQDYYQLHFNHPFNANWALNTSLFLTRGRGYYEEYKVGENFASYGLPNHIAAPGDTVTKTDLIRQLWLDNYYYGGLLSLFYTRDKTKITFGGGYNNYYGKHFGRVKWAQHHIPFDYQWYHLDAEKSGSNVFVKAEQQMGVLTLYGDLQWRTLAYEMKGFRKNPTLSPRVTYSFLNPKIGLSYNFSTFDNVKGRAYLSLAKASKEPNRDDFEASPVSLPQPEHLWDVEFGTQWNKGQLWNAGANFYYMDYRNQLILTGKVNDVGAYTRVNVAESFRAGAELMAAAQLFSWLELNGNITLSKNKINHFTEFIDDYDNGGQLEIKHHQTDIAFSPSMIGAWGLKILPLATGELLQLMVQNKYVGRQYLDNTQNINRSLNPYYLVDAGVQFNLSSLIKHDVSLQLKCNNVMNKKYEANGYTFSYYYATQTTTSNYYFPQAGTNWLVNMSYRF